MSWTSKSNRTLCPIKAKTLGHAKYWPTKYINYVIKKKKFKKNRIHKAQVNSTTALIIKMANNFRMRRSNVSLDSEEFTWICVGSISSSASPSLFSAVTCTVLDVLVVHLDIKNASFACPSISFSFFIFYFGGGRHEKSTPVDHIDLD